MVDLFCKIFIILFCTILIIVYFITYPETKEHSTTPKVAESCLNGVVYYTSADGWVSMAPKYDINGNLFPCEGE